MTIGIVIPCKNYEAYLADALASVRVQNVETRVVVVDDYSANPYAVRQAAGDCDVLHLPKPCGVGIARNTGAAYLHTGLLLFLDADDMLHAGALAALAEALGRHAGAAFAYGNYTENGAAIVTPAWDAATLERQNVASYCNLWRADAFWRIGGYCDIGVAEDWEIQRRAHASGWDAVKTNASIFEHRVHSANKWTHDSAKYGGLPGVSEMLRQYAGR